MIICFAGALAAVSGLAAFLASLWAGKTERPALWALGVAVVFAVAGAGAWLSGAELWLVLSVAGVSGAWGVFAALRSGALVWAAQAVSQPRWQAVLLLAAGLVLAGWGLQALENTLASDLLDSEMQLEQMVSSVKLQDSSEEALTDAGRAVPLFRPDSSQAEEMASFPEDSYLRQHRMEQHLIQTGAIDTNYNCHGWVFAGGQFWVRGMAVPRILEDNGYWAVARPRPGDIAVFRDQKGEVTHTALVRGRGAKGAVLLESKWGKLGRYVHTADKHVYLGQKMTYYRTDRGTHVLAGLPDPEQATSHDAEE